MQTFLTVLQVVLSAALIGLVLIQHGRGADAGAAFGSGASATVFGARGSGSFLTRATGIIATLFFLTSMAMAYYAAKGSKPAGLMEGAGRGAAKVEVPARKDDEPAKAAEAVAKEAVPAATPAASEVPKVSGVAAQSPASDVPAIPGVVPGSVAVPSGDVPAVPVPAPVTPQPQPAQSEVPNAVQSSDQVPQGSGPVPAGPAEGVPAAAQPVPAGSSGN